MFEYDMNMVDSMASAGHTFAEIIERVMGERSEETTEQMWERLKILVVMRASEHMKIFDDLEKAIKDMPPPPEDVDVTNAPEMKKGYYPPMTWDAYMDFPSRNEVPNVRFSRPWGDEESMNRLKKVLHTGLPIMPLTHNVEIPDEREHMRNIIVKLRLVEITDLPKELV